MKCGENERPQESTFRLIVRLSNDDPVIYHWLHVFLRGQVTWIEALHLMIIYLDQLKKEIMEQLVVTASARAREVMTKSEAIYP